MLLSNLAKTELFWSTENLEIPNVRSVNLSRVIKQMLQPKDEEHI